MVEHVVDRPGWVESQLFAFSWAGGSVSRRSGGTVLDLDHFPVLDAGRRIASYPHGFLEIGIIESIFESWKVRRRPGISFQGDERSYEASLLRED